MQINGIPVKGKQDTGAEISVMPLNIFDQLNSKLKGELKLNLCNDIKVIGYSKQSVKIVGKVTVTCSHAGTTKRCIFYVTDLTGTKVLLGLTFCRGFNLVKVLCDKDCVCKKMMVNVLNEFPTGLDVPKQMDLHQIWLIDSTTGKDNPTLNLQIANVTKTNINWNQIKLACLEDPTMIQSARTIQRGWPHTCKELPVDVKPYFQYRYILHIVDGIIFLQNRNVPIGLREAFLKKIHDAHLGIVKSKLLGWTLIYWPNWNSDVETTCQNCTLCRENQPMPANIPKFQVKANSSGEIYGINITDIHGKPQIVCVNYHTCIFERELRSLHSTDVIDALKSIFCYVRAANRIISDNARYFTSKEFEDFTMK